MPKQIVRVEIEGLFNRFNYDLDLKFGGSGITILTAPNGYGKSTILNMISNFANGSYYHFARESFSAVRFHISSGELLELVKSSDEKEKDTVVIKFGRKSTKIKNPFGDSEKGFMIERVLPFLTRIGSTRWRHDRTGEILNEREVFFRYGDHPYLKRHVRHEEWLESIRNELDVFGIPANRLKNEEEFETKGNPTGNRSSLMVSSIASDVKDKIQEAIMGQFEMGRRKEISFPARLIESLNSDLIIDKNHIFELLQSIQKYEERYARLGLLPDTERTAQLNYNVSARETAGMLVLKTYFEDICEKFNSLEGVADRLDVFTRSINKLLAFKYIETSPEHGIVVKNDEDPDASLPLSVLSSGEQHLMVLLGKLVFSTHEGAQVLIDEPEISFHPEWQESFIEIIEEIQKVSKFSTIIATHSPVLIGDRWNCVIELAEQYNEDRYRLFGIEGSRK